MAKGSCKQCQRELGQTALVRCRDTSCPYKKREAAEPLNLLAPLGGFGFFGAVGIVGVLMFQANAQDAADVTKTRLAKTASAPASNASRVTSDNSPSWSSWLFGDDSGAKDSMSAPAVELPDPRAASRVSSFSCSGSLSASEAAVCTNWDLATMDHNLSLLIQSLVSKGGSAADVRTAQAEWQRELNRLGGDTETVRRHYQKRIEELSSKI